MKHAQCTIIQLDEPARETWTSSLDFCLHVRFVSKCLYLPELSRPIILSVSSSRCKTMTTNNSLKNSYASGCSWDRHWVVHCSEVVPGGHNFKSSWAAKLERGETRVGRKRCAQHRSATGRTCWWAQNRGCTNLWPNMGICLVVEPTLWKMEFVSWGSDIPNLWKNDIIFQTTSQPGMGMYWINTWCLSKPRPVYFFIVWFTGRAWYMTTCTMDPRTGIHRIKTAISGGGQQRGNIHVWLYSAVSHQTLQWFFFRFNSNIKCIESATKTNQNSTGLTWPVAT